MINNNVAVALGGFEFHRFTIYKDFFGYDVQGVYEGSTYSIYLDNDLEVVDIESFDKENINYLINFAKSMIKKKIKSGIYEGNHPLYTRNFK